MSRSGSSFKKWGRGKKLRDDVFAEPWKARVVEDALWFDEYGAPFDLRKLPARQFEAHMAIIQGKNKEREKQQRKAEQENQA